MDLRRWRAKLPVQHTQCAESGYGWRYREGQRWSGPSNRQTARQSMRWSHTWSAAGRETGFTITPIQEIYRKIDNSTDTNLQREEDHCKAHDGCDAHCHHHWVSVMEAGDHSHHVGHTQGQDGLKKIEKPNISSCGEFKKNHVRLLNGKILFLIVISE